MADGSITATDKIQVEVRQDLHMADGFITVTHKECGLWSDRMYIQQFHHCGTQNADCGETGSTYSRTSWEQTSFGWQYSRFISPLQPPYPSTSQTVNNQTLVIQRKTQTFQAEQTHTQNTNCTTFCVLLNVSFWGICVVLLFYFPCPHHPTTQRFNDSVIKNSKSLTQSH